MPLFGRPSKTNGQVWSLTNPKGAYFQYETTRSSGVAQELLRDFKGNVMCDAYNGYEFLENKEGITLGLCMAHVRRKFFEALRFYPRASEILDLIAKLYTNESKANSFDDLSRIRKEDSSKILSKMLSWMNAQKGMYMELSKIGQAISYALENWSRITRFIDNVNMPIDNNAAERTQRRAVMGRKNFNGFKSIDGADTGMFFYSIVESCRIFKISPRVYMSKMATAALNKQPLLTPYEYAQSLLTESPKSVLK
jgi:transposase